MTHGLLFAGLAFVVYGAWLIYHPAGFLVAGILLILFALLLDRNKDS
jgi:glucose dehydrogenase